MGNLKQRKKQYTTLIIGIVLAMFFSSSILFFVSCMLSSNEEHTKRFMGNYYGYFYDPQDFIDIEKGVKDGYIEQYGYAHIVGYAYTDAENKDKGTPVAWLDEDAKQLYYTYLEEGRYPENAGEIAMEKDALMRLGYSPTVNETITVSLLPPDGSDYLPTAEEKTYTVVGVLADKRKNIEKQYSKDHTAQIAAAFVSEKEEIPLGGKENIALYFNPTKQSLKATIPESFGEYTFKTSPFSKYFLEDIYRTIADKTGIPSADLDVKNLMYGVHSSTYSYNESILNSAFLSITLASVLMLASCIGIINAFTTNLQERKKQIGMLRAVGATRRQIIHIFGREAFIIALICAPICVALSYFGVKLFAALMGDAFIFLPNIWILLGSVAISVVCVMLAAVIPLLRASRIPPMQAIRNVDLSRKMKRKNIKQSKEFHVPALLAKRSIQFYRFKQVGVSVMLILTILLTCFGFSYFNYAFETDIADRYNEQAYSIRREIYPDTAYYVNMPYVDKGITLNDVQAILDYPLFDSVSGHQSCISYIETEDYSEYMKLLDATSNSARFDFAYDKPITGNSSDETIDAWFSDEKEDYKSLKQKTNTQKELYRLDMRAYDEVLIEKNLNRFELIDGKINIDKLNSGEEIILIAEKKIGAARSINQSGFIDGFHIINLTNGMPKDFGKNGEELFATAELPYHAGDKIQLKTPYSDNTAFSYEQNEVPEYIEIVDKEVTIGAIVRPFTLSADQFFLQELDVLTTVDGMTAITNHTHDYENLSIDIKGENDDETDKDATDYLTALFAGSYFTPLSEYSLEKENKTTMQILLVALLAIVILFFSVCTGIVNNALTAKIRESKREIGTLRAVGASASDLTQSYIRQLLAMFGWGCGIGFGSYTAAHILLKIILKEQFRLPFSIWQAILICTLLFAVCSLNLYINIKKQMKFSIVENIREL